MELDELKKSWNALDEQLKKTSITDEKQIASVIARHKANAHQSISRLTRWQRLSVRIGLVCIALLLCSVLVPHLFPISEAWQRKLNVFVLFMGVSFLAGLWWDQRCYRWIKGTRMDEMPVAVVSRRMARFRQWMRYEIIAITLWVITFNALNYWIMDYYKAAFGVQAFLIALLVVCDAAIIYLFYKKVIYKYLDNVKKNIEDINDICTE